MAESTSLRMAQMLWKPLPYCLDPYFGEEGENMMREQTWCKKTSQANSHQLLYLPASYNLVKHLKTLPIIHNILL